MGEAKRMDGAWGMGHRALVIGNWSLVIGNWAWGILFLANNVFNDISGNFSSISTVGGTGAGAIAIRQSGKSNRLLSHPDYWAAFTLIGNPW